jgi:hypothetical protein
MTKFHSYAAYASIISEYANRADCTREQAEFDIFESELGLAVMRDYGVSITDLLDCAASYVLTGPIEDVLAEAGDWALVRVTEDGKRSYEIIDRGLPHSSRVCVFNDTTRHVVETMFHARASSYHVMSELRRDNERFEQAQRLEAAPHDVSEVQHFHVEEYLGPGTGSPKHIGNHRTRTEAYAAAEQRAFDTNHLCWVIDNDTGDADVAYYGHKNHWCGHGTLARVIATIHDIEGDC